MVDFTGGTWRSLIDGSEVSAIPDSEADQKLAHRYVLNDVNGTVADSAGDADGTNEGITSISGDFAGGSAGEGGDDGYIDTNSGTFTAELPNCAIAFTMKGTDGDGGIWGVREDGQSTRFGVSIGNTLSTDPTGNVGSGEIALEFADTSSDQLITSTDESYDDDNLYRVVVNIKGNSASDIDIYVNQSEVDITNHRDEGLSDSFSESNTLTPIFDTSDEVRDGLDTTPSYDDIIDDFCLFDESLTEEEAKSYENPWE